MPEASLTVEASHLAADAGHQTGADSGPLQAAQGFRIPFQSLRVIAALFIREMNTAYGRSSLGYLWSFIEPIGGIVILAISFSLIFRTPPLGDSFLLFYATGYLPFSMYVALHSRLAAALRQNKALMFYPAVTFVDVFIARTLLIVVSEVTVIFLVFASIMLTSDTGAQVDFAWQLIALLMVLGIGVGIGMVNAVLFNIYPSWASIWQILNRPIFFLSGVFFIFDALPPEAQAILKWNPVAHVIAAVRMGIYPEYESEFLSVGYVALVSLVLWVVGFGLLRKHYRSIINN